MAEQEVWGQETRVEVSKLVLSTNKLTDQVIRLLDAITGNFDDLIGQLTEATGAINGGVADLSVIKKDIEESIRKAQEDMGYVYQEFLTESTDIKGDISSLSGSVTQIKDSIEQLSTDSIFLSSKYSQLQGISDSLKDEISLYRSQVGNLQQSVTSVDQHVEVLKAELQNVSEMTQGNAESASNFEALLNELSIRVTKMTEDTVTYTATAKDLVDKYNAMKSVADESSTRANEAIVLANQAVIEVSALNTSVFGLQETAADIQSRITEYGSMADEINGKLATGTAEATSLKNFLEATSDDINNRLGYISSQIADANVKVNAINVRLDDVTSTLDGIAAAVGDMNTTVSQRLEEALQTIEDARGIAPSLTSSIESANASLINYTQTIGGAKADIDAIFESLHTYKTETDSVYERVTLQLDDLTAKADALTVFVNTSTEQISAANTEMQSSVQHVDEVRERVELIANEVETTYLKKVDQAVDSALIGGKDLSYLFHDDNAETKFAASPMLSQLKTDVANIQTLLGSDNSNLDTLQEIVDFIQVNKATLDSLAISNIAGLQTALDGKLGVDANATSASKWATARTITLAGAFSGEATLDGSTDVTLTATIPGVDKVDGLVEQLALKLDMTGVAADSLKLSGIDLDKFIYGTTSQGVIDSNDTDIPNVTKTGFYNSEDGNKSVIHIQKDAVKAFRIWFDHTNKAVRYRYKNTATWVNTDYTFLTDASQLNFTKLYNVPAFATRANTWDEVTDKPTTFTPTAHAHAWEEVTGKPAAFTPIAHTHLWDEVTGKPTTFTPSPHNHYSVISEGSVVEQTGTVESTYAGLSLADAVAGTAWVDGTRVGNVINAKGNTSSQLMISPNASNSPSIYVRGKLGEAESWSTWARVLTTADIITWDSIGSKPTTLAGFGITDGAPLSHVGSGGTAHSAASTSVAGFMSAADKAKLDGIATGANKYVHPTGNGNLHVPSNSGVAVGACLASGSTPGTLNWVSSIWRSYGVTQLAKTTSNTATYIGQYTKFLTVTLSGQYQDYTAEVTAMSAGNGTSYNQNSRLNIRIKQQMAFGSDPFIEVFQTQLTPVDKQRYFYSIVQNTPTTIVDFYVMNVESWNQINFFVQNDLLNGGSAAYLSAQAYTTTLPANAVEFSKSRLLTESYHPLADALTTARTLTWTGDATGAMTFNGSANVSSELTLAATGVTPGNYKSVNVDAKGRVLSGSNPTTLAEYGITDAAPGGYGLGGDSYVARGSANTIRGNGWQEYSADSGDTDGASTYGNILSIGSPANAAGYPGWASQIFMSTDGGMFFRANSAAGSFAGSAWQRVYSTLYRPSANDISALDLSGTNAMVANLQFANSGTTKRGIIGTVGANDLWFVGGGASSTDNGFLEISTGDGANEPIYVRQYYGSPLTAGAARTLTLLDPSGNTKLPGTLTAGGQVTASWSGSFAFATQNSTGAPFYHSYSSGGTDEFHQLVKIRGTPSSGTHWTSTFGQLLSETEIANTCIHAINSTGTTYSWYFRHDGLFESNGAVIRQNGSVDFSGNSGWSGFLRVGGNGFTVTKSAANASVATTNGSLHLDSGDGRATHINYYSGSGGVIFGDGNQNIIATLDATGLLTSKAFYVDNTAANSIATAGGINAAGTITAGGAVTAYSDIRLKEDIEVIQNPLEKVSKVSGVLYTSKKSKKRMTGVIAQEVREVLPEAVLEDEDGYLSVAYGNLVGLLVEAIKDQQKQIDELKSKML